MPSIYSIEEYSLENIQERWDKDRHDWRASEICVAMVVDNINPMSNMGKNTVYELLEYLRKVQFVMREKFTYLTTTEEDYVSDISADANARLWDRIKEVFSHPIYSPFIARQRLVTLARGKDPDEFL